MLSRQRSILVSIIAVGTIITAVSGAGVFAAVTDRATTGTNDVTSTGEPGGGEGSVDLQVATATTDFGDGSVDCGTFGDNLATGLFTGAMGAVEPGFTNLGTKYLCLRNAGTSPALVSWSAIDVLDTEVGCTGTEADYDATCGPRAGNPGELSDNLRPQKFQRDCATGDFLDETEETTLDALAATPERFAQLDAGEEACFSVGLLLRATQADPGDVFGSESDRVTWRFAFDASALAP